MKKTSDEWTSPEELLTQLRQQLENNEFFTQVTQDSGIIYALVEDSVPVLINFVPYRQTKEDEYILQIYFTLGKLHTTNIPLLVSRLDELKPHILLGRLCILPGHEIGYTHRMPIKISATEQAAANFQRSVHLMLLFLLSFLPYVRILAKNPESITLEQYLEKEE